MHLCTPGVLCGSSSSSIYEQTSPWFFHSYLHIYLTIKQQRLREQRLGQSLLQGSLQQFGIVMASRAFAVDHIEPTNMHPHAQCP